MVLIGLLQFWYKMSTERMWIRIFQTTHELQEINKSVIITNMTFMECFWSQWHYFYLKYRQVKYLQYFRTHRCTTILWTKYYVLLKIVLVINKTLILRRSSRHLGRFVPNFVLYFHNINKYRCQLLFSYEFGTTRGLQQNVFLREAERDAQSIYFNVEIKPGLKCLTDGLLRAVKD